MNPQDLPPREPMKRFLELSAIPRGSGNEKAASDYVFNFAKGLGLEAFQDGAGNVIVRKPACPGYENAGRVIIQGHLDMVCVKNGGVEHDFEKDGIKVIYDGGFLRARGTTLGADNGAAAAYAMAILAAEDIPHPPLTVIFTTEEETGMKGASVLDPKHLEAETLINLDSGGEGVFTVGCAGGLRAHVTVKAPRIQLPQGFSGIKLSVKGLRGGHSGGDIGKERANAMKLAGRGLTALANDTDIYIASVDGGEKENAIPREAEAVFYVKDADAALSKLRKLTEDIKAEHAVSDPGISMEYKRIPPAGEVFDLDGSQRIISALALLPSGPLHAEQAFPEQRQTSVSLGVVSTDEAGVSFYSAIRSSVRSRKYEVLENIRRVSAAVGADVIWNGDYPAWTYRSESRIREICGGIYKRMTGKEPRFLTVHGGLECGLFLEKSPGLDAVALGPDIFDPHSPDERMDAASFNRCWELLLEILKELRGA